MWHILHAGAWCQVHAKRRRERVGKREKTKCWHILYLRKKSIEDFAPIAATGPRDGNSASFHFLGRSNDVGGVEHKHVHHSVDPEGAGQVHPRDGAGLHAVFRQGALRQCSCMRVLVCRNKKGAAPPTPQQPRHARDYGSRSTTHLGKKRARAGA